jgi:flavin-dependent dehydrogenase
MDDLVIVGGGLAGLTLAILCARKEMKVTVLEKSTYPRQKVCGEYISKESLPLLEHLGISVKALSLPEIDTFILTSHHGMQSSCHLNPGGIGISRFKLDHLLAETAKNEGVEIYENTRVTEIKFNKGIYQTETQTGKYFESRLCVGSYGRISGLQSATSQDARYFVGVKYHTTEGPEKNKIEIHNFPGGYCGISAVEEDRYCLCYLAKAEMLKPFKGNIHEFEKEVLYKNKILKKRFESGQKSERIVTSQLTFGVSEDELPYPLIGDANGFIPPLTGNGMSLAFRGACNLYQAIIKNNTIESIQKESKIYTSGYLKSRINKGKILQNLLLNENPYFNKGLMFGLTHIPGLLPFMTRQAVGEDIHVS